MRLELNYVVYLIGVEKVNTFVDKPATLSFLARTLTWALLTFWITVVLRIENDQKHNETRLIDETRSYYVILILT